MKLLISTLITFALLVTSEREAPEETSATNIAHFVPAGEASFGIAETYLMDIDRDGKNDFSFQTVTMDMDGKMHTKYLVYPLGSNEILNLEGSAAISEEGEDISSEGNHSNIDWKNAHAEMLEYVYSENGNDWNGTWSGDRAQYLGIKLHKNGNAYIGWVRVEINPETEKATVKEYAINRKPGSTIVAGLE